MFGPNLPMSKAAFIEWSAAEEERCELVAGRVVMMPRPSRAHGMIVMNLAVLLRTKLDPKRWGRHRGVRLGCRTGNVALSRYRGRPRGRTLEKLYGDRASPPCGGPITVECRNRSGR